MTKLIPLRTLAHGRAGDKSDVSNISVIARNPADFDHLVDHVTRAHILATFASRNATEVRRYLLPKLGAMNFVIFGVLDGGVNRSLYRDRHGKSLSSLLLDSKIPPPDRTVR